MNSCELCSSSKFHTKDGYTYCTECGTQSQKLLVEIEDDQQHLFAGDKILLAEGVNLKKSSRANAETRLTSWEEYNYILVGLVDELVGLGANRNFKRTTLKLWTKYLQSIEAAFFALDDDCLPKLPANFEKRDAEILYNKFHRRRRRASSCSSAASKTSTGKAESVIKSNNVDTIIKQTKAQLKKALYESLLEQSQQSASSITTSLASTSQTGIDDKSNISLNLQFTSNARKVMKRQMPKKHIVKHETDHKDALDCHRDRIEAKPNDKLESLSNYILLSIIHMALNLTGDPIQWSDLIRFLREGHLSYSNIQHFLPANVIQTSNSNFEYLNRKKIFNHASMREMSAKLAKDMSIMELNRPDLVALSQRYADELCLPAEFKELLHQFIQFNPPEMAYNRNTRDHLSMLPNYEGRAISYVILLMKILFGVDDKRDVVISDSARRLNEILKDGDEAELFVFEDWLKFLHMRRIVLEKYHMPTAACKSVGNGQACVNSKRYADHLKVIEEKQDESFKKKPPNVSVNDVFLTLSSLGGRRQEDAAYHTKVPEEKSFNFLHTLTPFRDYVKSLLKENADNEPFVNDKVKPIISADFSRTIMAIFYRDRTAIDRLRTALCGRAAAKLILKEVLLLDSELNLIKCPVRITRNVTKYEIKFCSEQEYQQLDKGATLMARKPSSRKSQNRINTPRQGGKAAEEEKEEQEIIMENHSKILEDVILNVANCDYWLYFVNYSKYNRPMYHDEYQAMWKALPNNFKFLIEECCRITEQEPNTLLLELAALEKALICDRDEEFNCFSGNKNDTNVGPRFKFLW